MTAGALSLYPYQRVLVDKMKAAHAAGMQRPAAVLPTGGGKTFCFAHEALEYLADNPGRRVVVLAHRRELIAQAAAELRDVAPGLRVGVVMGTRNQTLAQVIVASVQSLATARRRRELLDVGLIIVDECHHAAAPTYLEILGDLGAMTEGSGVVAAGYTATMSRGDGVALGRVWQDVVYRRSLSDMIRDGYLVRPVGRLVRVEGLDLARVRKSAGDYQDKALGEALEASLAPAAIAKAYSEHCADRLGLAFGPTVHFAGLMADALNDAGHPAKMVSGATHPDERAQAIADLEIGKLQVVTNCALFTEGTNIRPVSAIVVGRPTKSETLYQQIVGRGLRLSTDPRRPKTDCLVLDVVGASTQHSLNGRVDLFGEDPEQRRTPSDAEAVDADDDLDVVLDEGEQTLDALGLDAEVGVDGVLISEEVDLFHGSESAWLTTEGGIWFLSVGQRYIAVVPGYDLGTWDVVTMHWQQRGASRWVIRGVADRAYALAWAEEDMTPAERSVVRKDRSWRDINPTKQQREQAREYGVAIPRGATAGEASNLIRTAAGTARIDPSLPYYSRGR